MNNILARILANPMTCTMLLVCAFGTVFMLSFLAALLIEKARDHKVDSAANDIPPTLSRYRTWVPRGAIRLDLGATLRRRTFPEDP
jgi:hypothetical protein